MVVHVLMVAEKPSLAESIASFLSKGQYSTRRGVAKPCPVHEFSGVFRGMQAQFKITSVIGHVYTTDFLPQYQNWETTDPATLFDAETRKEQANPDVPICRHLQTEAKGVDYLVLWLDCDREGENICFEVMDNTVRWLNRRSGQQVFRAKFSAITAVDIQRAMGSLVSPNEHEARAVDARQELDLKVGVAFTRFQTKYFQGKYGNLDAALVSYGPCQTPCLGFCVDRHDEIQAFQPEPFWSLCVDVENSGRRVRIAWERGRVFDHAAANVFHRLVSRHTHARLIAVQQKDRRKPRPQPLTTVELLKVASRQLGIGPAHAMQVAERLYVCGYVSYPRTESSAYSPNFDLRGALQPHVHHPVWGDYVRSLLEGALTAPRNGHDAGDHPPITPMRAASEGELTGDDWRIYDYIARHFIASVSPDCRYASVKARFAVGEEAFVCKAHRPVSPGFTLVMPWMAVKSDGVLWADLPPGTDVPIAAVSLIEGATAPPDYLTEAELIALMEKHGIGTDASIPTHINNICQRNYVQVTGPNRTLVPTHLGIALVHGYHKIDSELVLPTIRSNIEQHIDHIAKGKVDYQTVVIHALEVFKAKFKYFVEHISQMDELFEASFQPIAETDTKNKFRSKCGRCRRYMKLIPLKPIRLYCPTCEETYALPQNGKIKLYQENQCPLDGFELVLFTVGKGGMSYPLCPYCYNFPSLEGVAKGSPCFRCTHPTCKHSLVKNGISPCLECSTGTLVLDPLSAPNWRLLCNNCNLEVFLPHAAHSIVPASDKHCERCASVLLTVDFNKKTTPLPGGQTLFTGCFKCDTILSSQVELGHARMRMIKKFKKGGKRGKKGKKAKGRPF